MSNLTKFFMYAAFIGAASAAISLSLLTFAFNVALVLFWAKMGMTEIISQEQLKEGNEKEWQKT